MSEISKWAAGESYGPVLSQTDLYLLKPALEINPVFAGTSGFHLAFSFTEGRAGGFNSNDRERDLSFTSKDEPATLPRVQELILIMRRSPWCTIVKNEKGVTMHDVLTQLWMDYGEQDVTDAEFQTLNPRTQELIKRIAMINHQSSNLQGPWNYYPTAPPNRIKRSDWLRDHKYFNSMTHDPQYIASRLGFCAPNTFVIEVTP